MEVTKKRPKPEPLLWAMLALMLLIFCLSLITPMLADDYSYSFSYANRERIRSIGDIFSSLAAHREDMNGRMAAHFFAHLFLMLPRWVFSLANAIVFCLLVWSIFGHASGGSPGRRLGMFFMVVSSIWVFAPVFGQAFLWLDGACNYSWALCAILGFLYPYISGYIQGRDSIADALLLSKLLFLLLAFLAGSWSEGASFAGLFMAFCFILCLWHRDRKAPLWLILGLAAACLGYLFLMTAPSEWSGRTASFSLETVARNIKRIISAPMDTMLPLFILYALLFSACLSFKVRREVLVTAAIVFMGAWASLALFAVAVYLPWRSLLAMCLLLILGCAIMLSALWDLGYGALISVGASALGVVFAFQLILGCGDIANVYMQYRQREAQINEAMASGQGSVTVTMYSADTKYSGAYLLADVYEDPALWPNYDLAEYYGIGMVIGSEPPEDPYA